MELTNALYKYTDGSFSKAYALDTVRTLVQLLAPFAPHFSEELWERLGGSYSVFNTSFPTWDEAKLVRQQITYPLQINGKMRGKFEFAADAPKEEVESYVLEHFAHLLEGKELKKLIVVPGRIVNIVLK